MKKGATNKKTLSFSATEEEVAAFERTAIKLNYHNLSEWFRRTLLEKVAEVDRGGKNGKSL